VFISTSLGSRSCRHGVCFRRDIFLNLRIRVFLSQEVRAFRIRFFSVYRGLSSQVGYLIKSSRCFSVTPPNPPSHPSPSPHNPSILSQLTPPSLPFMQQRPHSLVDLQPHRSIRPNSRQSPGMPNLPLRIHSHQTLL
jgi:hypothetical protein